MAPHSSTLAWKIPWTEEPGRLQSMGSLRVGHDWATSLSLFTFMHWRRKWHPTPVFLPGESQGRGSLVGCRLWGCTVGHNWRDLAAVAAAVSRRPRPLLLIITYGSLNVVKWEPCVDLYLPRAYTRASTLSGVFSSSFSTACVKWKYLCLPKSCHREWFWWHLIKI